MLRYDTPPGYGVDSRKKPGKQMMHQVWGPPFPAFSFTKRLVLFEEKSGPARGRVAGSPREGMGNISTYSGNSASISSDVQETPVWSCHCVPLSISLGSGGGNEAHDTERHDRYG